VYILQAVIVNSACRQGRCECRLGYESSPQGCVKRTIGSRCDDDTMCQDAIDWSVCSTTSHRCTCRPGYESSPKNESCIKIPIERLLCVTDEDCIRQSPNTRCTGTTCACQDGFKLARDGTVCIKLELGVTTCSDNVTCSADDVNSYCRDGVCVCRVGFAPSDDKASCLTAIVGKVCITLLIIFNKKYMQISVTRSIV
jgi:hypothetical protein